MDLVRVMRMRRWSWINDVTPSMPPIPPAAWTFTVQV